MKINVVRLIGVLLLLASFSRVTAQTQTNGFDLQSVDYKPGQLWTMNQGITVTILAVGDVQVVLYCQRTTSNCLSHLLRRTESGRGKRSTK